MDINLRTIFPYQILFSIILLLQACQTDTTFEITTDEFILPEGFSIEAVAGEPLLDSPVAMQFDTKGRIWVVELPGYMRDIDGADEEVADGKIVVLADKNNDGRMDSRRIVIDSLIAPRTLLPVYGGLLYSNGTSLWWAELSDMEVLRTELVDSLYVVGGNIEHQPNNLLYHLDNWIYSANATVRYRRQNGQWLREATAFRGQWGLSADIDGRLYYNNNSLPIATDYTMPNQLIQNAYQKVRYGHNQAIATSKRLFAYQATAVNRGYIEGVLDDSGKVQSFTSACSPLVYTGNLLGDDFFQDVFVCAPEANLIKRYILNESNGKKIAVPAYENSEFLISREETFRPVNLYNGPDGSLYVLDMRKGIIQHRAYMTSYLREKILESGLEKVRGRGRIYRVTATAEQSTIARDYRQFSAPDWVRLLASTAAYDRRLAQQQLIAENAVGMQKAIAEIALNNTNPYGQLHALWTLEGLSVLDAALWKSVTEKATAPIVHETLIRFSAFFPEDEAAQISYLQKAAAMQDAQIDQQLLLRLGQMKLPAAQALLWEIIERQKNNPVLCEAIISGSAGNEAGLLKTIQSISPTDSLQSFLRMVINNKRENRIEGPQLPRRFYQDNRTAGFTLYSKHCASCHGMDGKGNGNLAPPLVDSEYVSGSKDRLILLTLNGIKGPITVNGKRYELNLFMPGIKNNPELTDKDIADLLVFLRNSFSFSDTHISEADVAKWREATKDRTELFTEEGLMQYQ